jgi:hypothetical protein
MLQELGGDLFREAATVRILEDEFDRWLAGIEPGGGYSRLEDAEAKCAKWLAREVSAGPKRMSRDEYMEVALKLFRESGLSKKGFLRVWVRVADRDWKKAGKRIDRS